MVALNILDAVRDPIVYSQKIGTAKGGSFHMYERQFRKTWRDFPASQLSEAHMFLSPPHFLCCYRQCCRDISSYHVCLFRHCSSKEAGKICLIPCSDIMHFKTGRSVSCKVPNILCFHLYLLWSIIYTNYQKNSKIQLKNANVLNF